MTIKPFIALLVALAAMALAPAAALADTGSVPSGATVLTAPETGPQRSCDESPEGCPLPEPPDGCPGCPPEPKPQGCGLFGTMQGDPRLCDWHITSPPGNDNEVPSTPRPPRR